MDALFPETQTWGQRADRSDLWWDRLHGRDRGNACRWLGGRQAALAHRWLYRSALTPAAAVERIRHAVEPTPQVKELVAFVEASRRGILGPSRGEVADDAESAD